MKRFYKQAAIVDAPQGDGFAVALDGRTVKTPGREVLAVPARPLAAAIVAEWDEQGEEVDPRAMPMTRFANTAIDRVRRRRPAVIDEIAAFGGTDLLCYRVSDPADLAARQDELWQPLLDWSAERYGAGLQVTRDIAHVTQPDESLTVLREAVATHCEFGLSALHSLSAALGSLVLSLAVSEGRLSAPDAVEVSLLDETWQAQKWGEDDEAVIRWEGIRVEVKSAARFLTVAT